MRKLLLIYILFTVNLIVLPSGKNMVSIGIGSLDYIELMIWSTFVFGSYYLLLVKLRPLSKLKILMSYKQRVAFITFSMLFGISMILGFMNQNEYAFSQMRGIALFIMTFIIFAVLFDFRNSNTERYYKYVCFLFVTMGISVILSYTSSTFTDFYSRILQFSTAPGRFIRSISRANGTYTYDIAAVTSLIYFYAASKILFKHKKIKYYIIASLGLVATNIFFHKPVVVSFILGNVAMMVLYVYVRFKVTSFVKIFKYVMMIFAVIYLIILVLPQQAIDQTIAYFNYGWLNIGRAGFEGDLSTGRLGMWLQYGAFALRGMGLAPWGMGRELEQALESNPHNIIIFLSYNIGIFSALLFIFFVLSITTNVLSLLKKQTFRYKEPIYSDMFGIVTYLVTVLIQAQYSGILDSVRSYILLFGSLLAVLLHLKHEFENKTNGIINNRKNL